MALKICTWNVNSVRARTHKDHDRLTPWLKEHQPDVVCLQELQCTEHQFPHKVVAAAGYRAMVVCQKGKNGVAILTQLDAPEPGSVHDRHPWPPEPSAQQHSQGEARFIAASVRGVVVACVYVPYGRTAGDPQWDQKLRFLRDLRTWCQKVIQTGQCLLLVGDINVTLGPKDAADASLSPKELDRPLDELWAAWCHADMRAALHDLLNVGLCDIGDGVHPFTIWDEHDFRRGSPMGVRVDMILASPPMHARLLDSGVHSDMRGGVKPSDHVPVFATFRHIDRIFGTFAGSRLHGLDTPNSDTDIKGVFLPSSGDLLLGRVSHLELVQRGKVRGEKNNALDVDVEFYSTTQFVESLLAGHPSTWELLFSPTNLHTADTISSGLAFISQLREHRHQLWPGRPTATLGFVDQHVNKYLRLQMGPKKVPVETFTMDPTLPVGPHGKLLCHARRALQQAQEMFGTGSMTFPRPNADHLLKIKLGQANAAAVLEEIQQAKADLKLIAERSSYLPSGDSDVGMGLVRRFHMEHICRERSGIEWPSADDAG